LILEAWVRLGRVRGRGIFQDGIFQNGIFHKMLFDLTSGGCSRWAGAAEGEGGPEDEEHAIQLAIHRPRHRHTHLYIKTGKKGAIGQSLRNYH
jgi:hypothetical protein